MGLYDREYYQEEPRGFLSGNRTAVNDLLIVNIAVYLADWLSDGWITQHFALQPDVLKHPWQIYQLLTYGFIHDLHNIWHILGNMFMLWMFGRDIESIYGRKQFLSIYLSIIILAGLCYVILQSMTHSDSPLLGASGGVFGILVLYALHYPFRMIYIYGIIPVPAWLLISLYVLYEVFSEMSQARHPQDRVAHSVHLLGAALALVYFKTGWTLASLLPGNLSLKWLKPGPKLRIHDDNEETPEPNWQKRVDEILEKISQHGEASLSAAERRTLEEASRRYQQRRQ